MTTSRQHPKPVSPDTKAKQVEDALDEALDESFPASDPVAVHPDDPKVKTPSPPASSRAGGHPK